MAPHDVVEWIYTLVPVVLVLAVSVCALTVWQMRRRARRHQQADPERLLRERHQEGAISQDEYAHRLRSFGGASGSDDVKSETDDSEQDTASSRADDWQDVPPRRGHAHS